MPCNLYNFIAQLGHIHPCPPGRLGQQGMIRKSRYGIDFQQEGTSLSVHEEIHAAEIATAQDCEGFFRIGLKVLQGLFAQPHLEEILGAVIEIFGLVIVKRLLRAYFQDRQRPGIQDTHGQFPSRDKAFDKTVAVFGERLDNRLGGVGLVLSDHHPDTAALTVRLNDTGNPNLFQGRVVFWLQLSRSILIFV